MEWSESRKAAALFGHLHAILHGLATADHAEYPNAENPDEFTLSDGIAYVSVASTIRQDEVIALELRWVGPSTYSGEVWADNDADGLAAPFENETPYNIGALIGATIHKLRTKE